LSQGDIINMQLCSASNAKTGEGLDEGMEWLSGQLQAMPT